MRRSRLVGWTNLVLSGVLMIGIWGLLVIVSARPAFKKLWDLSPQQRFTVSPATEELMRKLRAQDVQVEFHTLFEPLPPAQTEEQRHFSDINRRLQELTADLLRQYDYLGGDAVLVRHLDVRTDLNAIRELLKDAERNVLNFVVVRIGERSKIVRLWDDIGEIDIPGAPGSPQLPGGRPQLPILKDYRGEEALTAAVQSLLLQGKPVVYFLTGYRETDLDNTSGLGYSSLRDALKGDGFDIRTLNLESEGRVPADADLVALMEPRRDLTAQSSEALVEYVRAGGRLFVNFSYYPNPPEWNPTFERLGRLLGFELGTDLLCQLVPDPQNRSSPGRDGIAAVQSLRIFNVNPTHPVTKPLRQAEYPAQVMLARELSRRENAPSDLRVDESILWSDPRTWVEQRGMNGEVDLFAPRSGGALVTSAFRSRSVGMVIDVDSPGGGTGHVFLLSGATFINNLFAINSDLGLNIFNYLAERPVSVTVRGRAYQARELQLVPQQLSRIAWFLVGGVPTSLLLLGIAVFWRRSRI